ncbi:MAG: hypothetical protein Q9201_005329 [Fulgogasparrea decipioides]
MTLKDKIIGDTNSKFWRPWFSINGGDYLERCGETLGLQEKFQSYLKSQDENIQDYPYAYLVTAPRFLGYSFNPVSFWYLYNEQKQVKAMILEVNNTFDERRMYFLKDSISTPLDESGPSTGTFPYKFRTVWPKDFHVSPFNSRKGSYALNAHDPLFSHSSSTGMIDNTITLSSSKAHAKLVARVFSTQPSIDPATLGYWARLRFIAAWWWIGFVTFPRIVKEAGKLFFRRKLHVWYRPEVLKGSIGRRATANEIIIEDVFRPFLRALVEASDSEQSIKYVPPIPSSPTGGEVFTPRSHPPKGTAELKITTPLFYARLARHSHISEFLAKELFMSDDKDRTFYLSHPQPFFQLFDKAVTKSAKRLPDLSNGSSKLDRLRWQFLHWLRNHTHQSQQQHHQQFTKIEDIRTFSFSPLDLWAMYQTPIVQAQQYRTVVTKILLSDMIAFGYPEVLDAAGYVLRVLVSWVSVVGLRYAFLILSDFFVEGASEDVLLRGRRSVV